MSSWIRPSIEISTSKLALIRGVSRRKGFLLLLLSSLRTKYRLVFVERCISVARACIKLGPPCVYARTRSFTVIENPYRDIRALSTRNNALFPRLSRGH